MKVSRYLPLLVLAFWSGIAFGSFSLEQLPDGLPAVRANLTEGVLGTSFRDSKSIQYQGFLNILESKVYGLSQISSLPVTEQAEQVYYMEALTMGVIQEIANDPLYNQANDQFEQKALLNRAIHIYADVRHHGERLFEIMIRVIDKAKPGTSGIQLLSQENADILYAPNYRFEYPLSVEQMSTEYAKKLAQFEAKGGSMKEVMELTPSTIATFSALTQLEFVQMANGEVRATQGSAGHILMAEGKLTKAAGVMVIVKNIQNKVELLVISNSSGSYKPDMLSVESFASELGRILQVPMAHVLLTKGEPLSAQIVKIMMKAEDMDDGVIKAKMNEIQNNVAVLLSPV